MTNGRSWFATYGRDSNIKTANIPDTAICLLPVVLIRTLSVYLYHCSTVTTLQNFAAVLQALFDQVVLHRDSIVMVELWIGKRVRELLNEQDNEADKEENKPSSEEQDQLDDYEKDLEEEADSDKPEKVRRRGVRIVYEEQKLVGWSAFRLVKLTEMESEEG